MTKKDFIAIAAVLNANHADTALVLDMADMLGEQNPLFNRALFVDASTTALRDSLAFELKTIERETN
jgi:hypothetical protein